MFFDSIELTDHKILNACNIEKITIDINKPILIIIGDNGSGKSSLLREFTPWPAIQTSYLKGRRTLFLRHNDKKYKIVSDFKKGIKHSFYVEDGDDLNTGNTGALQKELCEQHFGLSPFINNIINMSYGITKMIPTERRNLFFNAYPFMNEILDKHKKVISIIRSYQTNLKMLTTRKTELLTEQMTSEEYDKILNEFNSLKQRLNNIEKYLFNLDVETNNLKEERQRLKTSQYYSEINLSELIKTYIEYNRSIGRISLKLDKCFKPIKNHTSILNEVQTEVSVCEYQKTNTESLLTSLRDEIDKYQSYLNTDVEEERKILLTNIETSTKVINTTYVDNSIPFIDEPTINNISSIITLLEEHILNIKQVEGVIINNTLLERIKYKIQTYSLYIYECRRKIEQDKEELNSIVNQTIHLPPSDCFHTECIPKRLLLTQHETSQNKIASLKKYIENNTSSIERYNRLIDKLKAYIDKTLICETNVNFIKNTLSHYNWYNYILRNTDLLKVLNGNAFVIINNLNILIRNSKYKLLIDDHEKVLKESQFRLSLIEKTPSRQIIDSTLLDRKTQLEKQLTEYERLKKVLTKKQHDINHITALKHINDSLLLLKNKWEVYNEFRVVDETIKWNEEFINHLNKLKSDITDKLISIETVVQKQNNINVRLKDEIEPSINKIEIELKKYKLIESALSPSTGIPKPNMIEFINEIIKDANHFVSAILTMDDLEILPIDKNIESVNYTFPVRRNEYTIPDISECSKAQKNIIDLCWNLALYKQLGLNNNYPLIMDEPDDGYSEGNRTRLLMLLSSLVEEGHIHQLILVSHFASMLSGFENSDIVCLAEDNILLPLSFNSCCKIN